MFVLLHNGGDFVSAARQSETVTLAGRPLGGHDEGFLPLIMRPAAGTKQLTLPLLSARQILTSLINNTERLKPKDKKSVNILFFLI